MALSREEIAQIAKATAWTVLEGLHRYAVEYKEPETIGQGLQDSMVEESTAIDWYRKRATHAASLKDTKTSALYYHIADEEADHLTKFNKRFEELKGKESTPEPSKIGVLRDKKLGDMSKEELAEMYKHITGKEPEPGRISLAKKPTRYDVIVTQWAERDRHHIGIVDKATEQISYADWWDDDARQMFEDGFFLAGKDFENSVLGYAEDMGILSK